MLAHVLRWFVYWTFVHSLLDDDAFCLLSQYITVIIIVNNLPLYQFKFIRKEKTFWAKFQCSLNKLIKLMKEPRKMVLISAFVKAACIILVENEDATFFLLKIECQKSWTAIIVNHLKFISCVWERVIYFQKVALTQKAKTFTCTFFENVWSKLDLHFIGFDTVKLVIYTWVYDWHCFQMG